MRNPSLFETERHALEQALALCPDDLEAQSKLLWCLGCAWRSHDLYEAWHQARMRFKQTASSALIYRHIDAPTLAMLTTMSAFDKAASVLTATPLINQVEGVPSRDELLHELLVWRAYSRNVLVWPPRIGALQWWRTPHSTGALTREEILGDVVEEWVAARVLLVDDEGVALYTENIDSKRGVRTGGEVYTTPAHLAAWLGTEEPVREGQIIEYVKIKGESKARVAILPVEQSKPTSHLVEDSSRWPKEMWSALDRYIRGE